MERRKLISTIFLFAVCLLAGGAVLHAQADKEKLKIEKQANNYLRSASSELDSDDFVNAEVDLRKAISLIPADETGKYNLGNAYYDKDLNDEAMRRYLQAAEIAQSKLEKHKAYHNLGNTFMNSKKYQEAVEAYKNALRNNPTDDETRYNLALAKEMLEKNPPPEGGDDDKEEENNKDEENKDQNENKDDQGKDQEGDEGDEKENEDKGDEQDENKEGENKDDRGNPKDPNEQKDGEGEQPQQQKPVPGQLSPQQIKNLLEAMNNEEKKVQDKINARKQKGAKVKSNKDW
ncbi:tetratricopeptide repeat protein [Aureitalea sp. L0-47]|uniref:tetratricopeptide repeat protein n=1 Tax=Aureitalea sp. L0-47 TaxID=2816962 RepID=UPI002238510B|nr:tetratricopeptide repeat protein [Aureitalea sp. L0-47]MCW5520891.1 tetratricopeptide repeat protein [Aureitalea sp. L0-47]